MRFPSARFFAISESLSGDGRTIAIAGHDPDHPELKLVPLEGSTESRSLPVKLPEPGVLSSAAWVRQRCRLLRAGPNRYRL